MQFFRQILLLIISMIHFSACALEEDVKTSYVTIESDLKHASLYIDTKKVGQLEKGSLTLELKSDDYTFQIEQESPDGVYIYAGKRMIYVGESSSSTFEIPYLKRETQATIDKRNALRENKRNQKILDFRRASRIMYLNKARNLHWQNEKYSSSELKAYKDNVTYKKVGSWSYAQKYCKDLHIGALTNWRLPSVRELKVLYKEKFALSSNVKDPFWSATSFKQPAHAWHVSFGKKKNRHGNKNLKFYIRCVRDAR